MDDASTTKPNADAHDWSRFDAMSEAERTAAALADPDAKPVTPEDDARMPRTPQIKVMCRALGLTLEVFAAQYQIPLTTVEDWVSGRSEPDAAMQAYLRVIAREPDMVRRVLEQGVNRAA
jgi:putative transcriptional regulator